MAFNWYTVRTPEQWAIEADNFRTLAKECAQRSRESFERCDTDGYLSQWAADSMARHYHTCAELCDAQGMQERIALFDLDGKLAATRMVTTQYGTAWLTRDGKFVNPSRAKKGVTRYRNLKAKGYTEGTIRIRCGVFSRSDGPYQVVDVIEPLRDTTDVEIITTDNGIGENWT